MGCGKSTNQAAVKKGEVYQPEEVNPNKPLFLENTSEQKLEQSKHIPAPQHIEQQEIKKSSQEKEQKVIKTSYLPNGKPNPAFEIADKYSHSTSRYLYFFGVNQINEQQILKFDIEGKQFENIYGSLSQEQKDSINIYNYTLCLQIDEDNIFICGGINQELTEIQNDTYIFNTKNLQFTKYENLVTPRYTHFGLVHNKKVYCLGGRSYGDDDQAILRSCEVFDLEQGIWDFLPPLSIVRCTAMTFVYNKTDIYVAGGYSGPDRRTKRIEKFNNTTNQWEVLDFKLHRGLEGSFYIASKMYNEVIIFGGYCKGGATSSITSLNIQEKTVRYKGKMLKQRVLHKAIQKGERLFIFGGDEGNQVEQVNLSTFKSEVYPVKSNFSDFCDQFEIEKYSASLQTQEIEYLPKNKEGIKGQEISGQSENENNNEQKMVDSNIHCLFGTDDQPFMIEFNGKNETEVTVKSIPTNLSLSCYQGGCRISQNQIFLAGGVTFSMSQVLSKCFIYDQEKKEKIAIEPMIHQRYAFNCIFLKETNDIYIIGGRSYTPHLYDDNFTLGDPSQDDQLLQKLQFDSQVMNGDNKQNGQNLQTSQLEGNKNKQANSMKNSQLINNRSHLTQNKNESKFYENTSQLPQDQNDVLVHCEKFNLKTKIWSSVAQLKRPRSSACSFVYSNKIYVYGGYHGGDIYNTINMESYDSKTNRWEEHNISIDKPITSLEASQMIQKQDDKNKFLIFGGQIGHQSSNSIWELDVLNLSQKEISHMKYQRYLHKTATVQNSNNIVILGGNQESMIEFYPVGSTHPPERDEQSIINNINDVLSNILGDKLMKKYILL